jgi:hypothetical protein
VVIEANGNKDVQTIRAEAAPIKLDQWNEYRVIAKGNRFVHEINGEVTAEIVDRQKSKATPSGIIALQLHRGPAMQLRIKDIRLKRLP